jgi:hypothetical protein
MMMGNMGIKAQTLSWFLLALLRGVECFHSLFPLIIIYYIFSFFKKSNDMKMQKQVRRQAAIRAAHTIRNQLSSAETAQMEHSNKMQHCCQD